MAKTGFLMTWPKYDVLSTGLHGKKITRLMEHEKVLTWQKGNKKNKKKKKNQYSIETVLFFYTLYLKISTIFNDFFGQKQWICMRLWLVCLWLVYMSFWYKCFYHNRIINDACYDALSMNKEITHTVLFMNPLAPHFSWNTDSLFWHVK